MKKNKVKISLFIYLSLLITMLFSIVSFPISSSTKINTVSAASNVVLSLSGDSNSDTLTKNASRKNVGYYILLSESCPSVIKVRLRTISVTAIENVDYTPTDRIIEIPQNTKEYSCLTEVNSIQFTVGKNYNCFKIELCEVLTNNATINPERNILTVNLFSEDEIEMGTTGAVTTYGAQKADNFNYRILDFNGTIKDSTLTTLTHRFVGYNSLMDNQVNYGLANYYCTGGITLDEDWDDTDDDPIYVTLYDGSTSGTKLYSVGVYNLWDEQITYGKSYDDADKAGEYINSDQTTTYSEYLFMRVPSGTVVIGLKQSNTHDRRYSGCWFIWQLFDFKPAQIKGYYIDKNPMRKNQPLRICVRLDEPVHIAGTSPSINATLVGTGAYANKQVTFNYAGGEGTNTLYFDYQPSELGTISNISINGINYWNSVRDYCYNTSGINNICSDLSTLSALRNAKCQPSDFGSDLSVTFDSRNPSLDCQSQTINQWATTHKVSINADGNEFSKINCKWSENPEMDESDIVDNESTNKSFETTLSDVSGTYYLHVVARTKYSADVYTKTTVGPFYIDNESPVIQYNLDSVGTGTKERQIQFELTDSVGVDKIYLYYSTNFFSDENLPDNEPVLVYDANNSNIENVISNYENNIFTVIVNAKNNLGFEEGKTEFGDYYIGFKAIDKLGNESKIIKQADVVNFDIRDSFECDLYVDNILIENNSLLNVDNAFVIDISNGQKEIKIVREGLATEFKINSFAKFEGNKKQTDQPIETYFTYKSSYIGTDNASFTYTTKDTGYYEIIMVATNSENQNTYSKTIKLYIVNTSEQADTLNYSLINNNGVNLKNNVYMLGNGRYFYRNGTGMGSLVTSYYNNSQEPLVFSSKIKAIEYIKTMEMLDMLAIRLTVDDVNSFRNGTMNISPNERRTPEVGQVWIRYKASTWNFTSAVRDWVYYYYGDTNESTSIDTQKFSADLSLVLDSITNLIVNRGGDFRLTTLSGLNENGIPEISSIRIPLGETYTETKNSTPISVTYEFDTEIYADSVIGNENVSFISWYKWSYNYATKVFYATVDESKIQTYENFKDILTSNYEKISTDSLRDYISQTGYYAICEVDDKGIREYLVYMDYDEPKLIIQYTDLLGTFYNNDNLSKESNGRIIHTKDFSIREFNDNADNFAHIDIFDIREEKVLYKSFTLQEFKDEKVLNSHFDLTNGYYEIQVFDRSGNNFKVFVSVAANDLSSNIEVIPNNKIVYILENRIANDVLEFEVRLNGQVILTDFSASSELINGEYGIYFYESGVYEFTVTDVFGYTVSDTAELTRTSPAESIGWFVRKDYGSYDILDEKSITEFGANGFYIATDSQISFMLPDLEIYTYEFTGDLTFEEYVVEGKKYVDITSDNKWAVKISYIRYPSYYVIYNRISTTIVPPAPINIKGEVGYLDTNNIVQPDSANNIVIYVYTDANITEDIKVYVQTKNKTAIAELGDYEAYNGFVVLTPDNPSVRISINTTPSGFTVYDKTADRYFSREFEVIITEIEGNAEIGDSQKLSCAVLGMNEVTVTNNGSTKFFEAYIKGFKDYMGGISFSEYEEASMNSSNANRYYDDTKTYSVNYEWFSTYIETGLAKLFTTVGMTAYGDDIYGSYGGTDAVISLYEDNDTLLYKVGLRNFDDDENNYVLLGYSNGELKPSNEYYDKNTSITISAARGDAPAARYYLVSSSSLGNFKINIHESTFTFTNGGDTFYVLPERYFSDLYGYSIIVDSTAPEVVGYYLDHDVIKFGQNLRLCVRFSEPVYVNGTAPYINAKVNGSSLTMQFLYAGGSGTDTLYFELNPETQLNEVAITAITIQSIGHETSIHDYGYNSKSANNTLSDVKVPTGNQFDFSCFVDTRSPEISSSYTENDRIVKNVVIPVSFSRVSSGALVQYAWSREASQPENFDNSFTLTNIDQRLNIESNGLSGIYYLHVQVTSLYGKITRKTFGPINLDSQAPSIRDLVVEEAEKSLMERTISFYVSDYPLEMNCGIDKVYMVYSTFGKDDFKTIVLYDSENSENNIFIDPNGKISFKLSYVDLGMSAEEQRDLAIGFYANDKLGNELSFTSYTFYSGYVNFDSRSIVDVTVQTDIKESFEVDDKKVYDTTNGLEMDFIFARHADDYQIKEVSIKGVVVSESDYLNYFSYESFADGLHLTFNSGVSGYFTFKLISITGEQENQTIQETNSINFYLTVGTNTVKTDNYNEIQKGTLFVNKVFFLNTEAKYFYHDGNAVQTLYYNGNSSVQAFSSKEMAYNYVYYYEMQDLYAMLISTSTVASSLNNGDGGYRKAVEDSNIMAKTGQVWVRYKRSTWDNSQNPDGWVYYYYGNDVVLNPASFSQSLLSALSNVATKIVNAGKYSYLTSDDGLDKNNAPYLNPKQLHLTDLSTYVTKCNTQFISAITYYADTKIYDSIVTPVGYDDCSIATSYVFNYSPYTAIYYAKDYGRLATASEFVRLPEGLTFANFNIVSGVYWVREVDGNGMRDYRIYIDKTAPTIRVSYVNSSDVTITRDIDSSIAGSTINGKTLYLLGIGEDEVDKMAYIALFKKSGVLVGVYRQEDFINGGIQVPEGQYYIEIMDRSGNKYVITIRLNTTPMVCQVVASENSNIRISCNRDNADIALYEIYLDNELIESNYSQKAIFYQAGVYTIKIEDWYGNVFYKTEELKRSAPQIDWSYEENDRYVLFDGTQNCISLSKVSEREYKIVTNKKLMFVYESQNDYSFEFTDPTIQTVRQEFNGKARIKINTENNWIVKIYYTKYPNIYSIYQCIIDNTAPTITVTTSRETMTYLDDLALREENQRIYADGEDIYDPDKITMFNPNTIYFVQNKVIDRPIQQNSTVFSNILNVKLSDASVCNRVTVYINGELLDEFTDTKGVADITLSRFGDYKIVAYDTLGNSSEFNFKNYKPDTLTYIVDNKNIDWQLNPLNYMNPDENNNINYPVDVYGNTQAIVGYNGNYEATFLIKLKGNSESYYVKYQMNDNVLAQITYRLRKLYDENTAQDYYVYERVQSIINIPQQVYEDETSKIRIASTEEAGIEIFAKVDSSKNLLFLFEAQDNEATIEGRFDYDSNYQPYFVKFVLSNQKPTLTFVSTTSYGEQIEVLANNSKDMVYLSGNFYIKHGAFEDENITKISIAYSKTTDFKDYDYIWNNREFNKVVFEDEGFYSVIAENIYGTKTNYVVLVSNSLNVITTSIYDDETSNIYSLNKDNVLSNSKVILDIYTNEIEVEINHNGSNSSKAITSNEGIISMTFTEEGVYSVTIYDKFRNIVVKNFEIKNTSIDFKEEYLSNYNQKALKYSEGYTNQKLKVEKEKMDADNIAYMEFTFNGEVYVVFNNLSETAVNSDDSVLNDIIGSLGDGQYDILIRDNFGSKTTKTIYYKGISTLNVNRYIRTSNVPQQIELNQGENTLYSNYSFEFETTANLYETRIDGVIVQLPYTVFFPSDRDDEGEYVQKLTYIDEYGFEYNLTIYLVRIKYDFDFSKYLNVVTVDDMQMTKDNVKLVFDSTATATYTLNGEEKLNYVSGTELSKDGTYRFYITDIAGNITTATIRKDTMVEYIFTYAGSDRQVENGCIINSGAVKFSPVNKDSAEIKIALLNDEVYKDFPSSGFSEPGKWEFIIVDEMGNSSYFYFYIITHSISKFEYTTPYTFKITEVLYDSGDGIQVSYINSVSQYQYNSKMVFSDSGKYVVKAMSSASPTILNFEIEIDKTLPKVELVGVENNSTTVNNVELVGYEVGDVIQIYKDEELIKTIRVTSSKTKVDAITTQGNYRIVVTNAAGNSKVFEFVRQFTANTATTIFILMSLFIITIMLFVFLISRKRLKV